MPLPKPKHETWPLDKIIEGQNARKVEIDDGIRELCNSIVANGLLQPLIGLDNHHLIAGFRRLAALRLAKIEAASVLVYPSTLTPSQIKVINLTENVQRVDLSEPEIYLSCSELLKLNPEWARKDLATHLGKDPSTVTRWLSPDDLIPEARQAFLDGKFGFAKAYAIAKLPPEAQGGLLALTLSGATRDELESHGRRRRASAVPAVRASKIRVPLVSGPVVTIAGEEVSMEEALEAVLEAAKQLKAAIAKGITAKSAQAYWKDLAAAS